MSHPVVGGARQEIVSRDRMREVADEPVEVGVRIMVQVRASRFWAGVYELTGDREIPGRQILTVKGRRPEGRTPEDCVRRITTLLGESASRIVAPAESDDEGW